MNLWLFLCCLSLAITGYNTDDQIETVMLETPSGPIKGIKEIYAETGEPFYEFRGIPFGKPPIGPLRFKKSIPFGTWKDTLDATAYGAACPQNIPEFMPDLPRFRTSEDCLFINVIVPKVLEQNKSLSVMVWIHGGGLEVGFGHDDTSPRLSMEGNVILVSLHYRLGIFGFLALDHPAARGNYGLWDQKLALHWVHNNIEAFGGNPDSVTIFGESAGGYSTSLQSLIPSNKGLFQRVISQSGVHSRILMRTSTEIRNYAKRLSIKSDCPIDDKYKFVDCLRDKSVEEMLEIGEFYSSLSPDVLERQVFFKSQSYPVVDGELYAENPIKQLEDETSEVSKFFRSLDFIAGTTSNEGSLLYMIIFPEMQEHYAFNLTEGIPHKVVCEALIAPYVELYLKNDETIKRKLCEFYYEDGSLIEQSRRSTYALADIMFTYPTVKMLEYHTGGKGKTYQYRFSKISPEPFGGPPPEWFEGCGHGDELLFMFKAGEADLTEEDKDLSKKLIQYWTSFAKAGLVYYCIERFLGSNDNTYIVEGSNF